MLCPLRNLNERFHPYFTLKAFKSQEHFALYLNYCKALFEKKVGNVVLAASTPRKSDSQY